MNTDDEVDIDELYEDFLDRWFERVYGDAPSDETIGAGEIAGELS